MYSGLDIAYKTLGLVKDDPDLAPGGITPLKLQKLLFYMQGWYAANTDKRLFSDDIYAWGYGPVVEAVYYEFRTYGSQNLIDQKLAEHQVTTEGAPDVDDDLRDVLRVYGKMSAYELVSRTHMEDIWRKNHESSNKVIPFEDIRKAFKSKLVGDA
jgi:uncharacterized phage-associated protein